jgi:hypothetical protein
VMTLRWGMVGLVRGDPTLVEQRLHEGVVAGDLLQLAVAQQVARESRHGRGRTGCPLAASR